MIALDTSALAAIALMEPGWETLSGVLRNNRFAIGWPTVLELRMVLARGRPKALYDAMEGLLALEGGVMISFGADHFGWAEIAFEKYGKGRGHAAQLNFGDCMAYAVAKALDAPLLFKGDDFAKTDVKVHPASIVS